MTQVSGIGSGSSAFAAAMQSAQAKPSIISVTADASTADRADGGERAGLEKAAKAFEAIFTRQLLGSMRQAGLGEGIGDSSAGNQFREMADADMANDLAEKGGLGIAQLILQQLERKP